MFEQLLEEIKVFRKNNISFQPKEKKYHNKYDQFINKTEKLWKTNNQKYIQDLESEKKIIGRKFLVGDQISYLEIFEDQKLTILGLSKKITLLYLPLDNQNNQYDPNNCIGFRYYQKDWNEKCNYFTLINRYKKKYYILEKSQQLRDVNNELFYDENLDCFALIKNIVYEKYIYPKSKRISNGELFPELIGYAYAIHSLKNFKNNFKIIEPFIPDRTDEESLKEELPEILEPGIGYIEPIFFDSHVAVLLVTKSKNENKKRFNVLFDLSRYFSNNKILDSSIFPIGLYNNFYAYPYKSIQKNTSCGLWYYGVIECIYSNEIYQSPEDIFFFIQKYNDKFYFDIINSISKIIYNNNNIIDDRTIEEFKENDLDNRIFKNNFGEYLSFSKECFKCYFFSLSNVFDYEKDKYKRNEMDDFKILLEYQILFDQIMDYLRLLRINRDYFELYSKKPLNESLIYENVEKCVIRFLNDVEDNFKVEYKNTILNDYCMAFNNEKKIPIEFKEIIKSKTSKKKEIPSHFYYEFEGHFQKIKEQLVLPLLTENQILNNLNPKGNFWYQLMNK